MLFKSGFDTRGNYDSAKKPISNIKSLDNGKSLNYTTSNMQDNNLEYIKNERYKLAGSIKKKPKPKS